MISFSCDGTPVPQGSMKVINGHILHSQGSALAVWRSTIALSARFAGAKPVDGAIGIEIIFRVKRPKTVKRDYPTVAPDLDKYIRGVLDSLTGIGYIDDSQVIDINAKKVYSDTPGADIKLFAVNT
jgi:Holliday junction resolvase RusA-like endonuclease